MSELAGVDDDWTRCLKRVLQIGLKSVVILVGV